MGRKKKKAGEVGLRKKKVQAIYLISLSITNDLIHLMHMYSRIGLKKMLLGIIFANMVLESRRKYISPSKCTVIKSLTRSVNDKLIIN